ncbi:hypothetical protein [Paraburkholderia sp. ZP32-5]|uniref:hypothetical protein n=1 Tax=Paraburkholderia sp. ZP32-5 TaxID=2883245 RepID=UPI001F42BA8D|nr:hypothetical protein [Paraburkholderia sp. ZP32-5]
MTNQQGVGARFAGPMPPFVRDMVNAACGDAEGARVLDALRSEDEVMSARSLRAAKATSLSFARSLVARMKREQWRIECVSCDIDAHGEGTVVYEITAAGHVFHFAAFSQASDGVDRPGRFTEWTFDFLGILVDGPADLAAIAREREEIVGKVWRGRTTNPATLGWTVANRSNRFYDYVLGRLEAGQQPEADHLANGGGYIIRNAGYYANGRHGTRAWVSLPSDHPLAYPYHIDLFALYMWRLTSFSVVDAQARSRNAGAARLEYRAKLALGVGNSSGLGMVATLVRWPAWLSAFSVARELALAYATTRDLNTARADAPTLAALLKRSASLYAALPDGDVDDMERHADIAHALSKLALSVERFAVDGSINGQQAPLPWRALLERARSLGSDEAHGQLAAHLIALYPQFAAAMEAVLPAIMKVTRQQRVESTVGELLDIADSRYRWALDIDRQAPGAAMYFWYKSGENGENRRGERAIDPGVDNETFVDVAGAVQAFCAVLRTWPRDELVARVLLDHPEFVHIASRMQLAAVLPYSEIRENLIGESFFPMDAIRFLLTTFGLETSQPVTRQWVRGVFLLDAPLPEDFAGTSMAQPDDTRIALADSVAAQPEGNR